MAKVFRKRFEVQHEKAYQKFVINVKKKVFPLIYTGFLPKESKYADKDNLSLEIIAYFYELNEKMMYVGKKKMSDGIHMIWLMPHFDGEKGYEIVFDRDSLLTEKMFEPQKYHLGRTRCSYEILKAIIDLTKKPSTSVLDEIKKMMITDNGPTLTDKMKHGQIYDRQKWFQSLSSGDHIHFVYDTKSRTRSSLLLDVSAKKSSFELFKIIEKYSKEGKLRMKALVDGGDLSHYYNVHIKNSKRNNGRNACELQRFLKVMINTIDDRYAYYPKDEKSCIPKVGISKTVQYENILGSFDLDPLNYHKYILWMKDRKVGLYSNGLVKKKCMTYFCGTNYFPLFRKEAITRGGRGSWKTWVELNKQSKQFALLDFGVDDSTERFMSVPPTIVVEDLAIKRKKRRRKKMRKRKRRRKKRKKMKKESMVVIVQDPRERQEAEMIVKDHAYKQDIPFMYVFSKVGDSITENNLRDEIDPDVVYEDNEEINLDGIPGTNKKIETNLYNSYLNVSITD
jgi:hypothetical protein